MCVITQDLLGSFIAFFCELAAPAGSLASLIRVTHVSCPRVLRSKVSLIEMNNAHYLSKVQRILIAVVFELVVDLE